MKARKERMNEQMMNIEKTMADAVSSWKNDDTSETLKPSDPSAPPGPEDAKELPDSKQDDEEIPPEPHK